MITTSAAVAAHVANNPQSTIHNPQSRGARKLCAVCHTSTYGFIFGRTVCVRCEAAADPVRNTPDSVAPAARRPGVYSARAKVNAENYDLPKVCDVAALAWLQNFAARNFRVSFVDIAAARSRRQGPLLEARRWYWWAARILTSFTLEGVASGTGHDHSSVNHGILRFLDTTLKHPTLKYRAEQLLREASAGLLLFLGVTSTACDYPLDVQLGGA